MPASVGSCMNFIACTTVVAPAADAAAAGAAAGSLDSTCTGGWRDAAPSAVNGLVFHAGAHLPLPPAFTCPPRPPIIDMATPLRPAGVRGATKAEDESVSASIISGRSERRGTGMAPRRQSRTSSGRHVPAYETRVRLTSPPSSAARERETAATTRGGRVPRPSQRGESHHTSFAPGIGWPLFFTAAVCRFRYQNEQPQWVSQRLQRPRWRPPRPCRSSR